MALPKKRKKLENIASNNNAADMISNIKPKTMQKKSAKGSTAKASPKKSEQMSKAFEIMDRIENHDDPQQKAMPSDVSASPVYPCPGTIKSPERIRFRISFDRKANTCPEHEAAPVGVREIDFGITIPSIIWKIPVLKKAAEKVLSKLSTHE